MPQRSLLDALLLGEWEDRAEAGLFRYDVTACPTKLVPGSYGFVAQCNEGRLSKKRPTEFRIDQVGGAAQWGSYSIEQLPMQGACGCGAVCARRWGRGPHYCQTNCLLLVAQPPPPPTPPLPTAQVAQPFDGSKFNFTKALQKECLLMFEPGSDLGARHGRAPAPAFQPAVRCRRRCCRCPWRHRPAPLVPAVQLVACRAGCPPCAAHPPTRFPPAPCRWSPCAGRAARLSLAGAHQREPH